MTPAQCTTLLQRLPSACPNSAAWSAATAEQYQCSEVCSRALVTAFTQCQTSLFGYAGGWTQEGREALYVLTRPSPEGPCRRAFGEFVSGCAPRGSPWASRWQRACTC
jgi:hypothetical protein